MNDKIQFVESRIEESCKKSHRNTNEVTLIAVSKTKPLIDIQQAYDLGLRDFGENKVQELCEKHQQLPSDIRWHMIGHLQRNKVKYIADFIYLIHSVDSFRLAEEIEKQGEKCNRVINVLVEVNIAKEQTKFGVFEEDCLELVSQISVLPHVHVCGLMTSAPYVEDSQKNRQYFHKMKQLAVDIKKQNIDNVNMEILSMGMSQDYDVAVEEGSTMVRVGTGIFGKRDYKI